MPASVEGARLFNAHCTACHGTTGRGDGPAAFAFDVRPRNFRAERFRYISTLKGTPAQEDLIQTIRSGRHFGSMPAGPQLTDAEVDVLADYVRALHRLGRAEELAQELAEDGEELDPEEIEEITAEMVAPGEPIAVPMPGPDFRPDTAIGRKLYLARCAACHGPSGLGDGLDMPLDERGKPITVRDLTSEEFRGGVREEELFKRILCGIPGTPMPSQERLTDEETWQLVHYVLFLAGRRG